MPVGNWFGAAVLLSLLVLAGLAWLVRGALGRSRSERMEAYLRLERANGTGRGQRSSNQIMRALNMTAGQVLDAARRSPAIKQLAITANAAGVLSEADIMFEYAPLGAQGRDAV